MDPPELTTKLKKLYKKYADRKVGLPENFHEYAHHLSPFDRKCEEGKIWQAKTSGLKVQSLGELLIAEHLDRRKIPYVYDELVTITEGYESIWLRPDFRLDEPHHRIIIEYFGLLNNQEYAKKAITKMEKYRTQGDYRVFGIFPKDLPDIGAVLNKRIALFRKSKNGVDCIKKLLEIVWHW